MRRPAFNRLNTRYSTLLLCGLALVFGLWFVPPDPSQPILLIGSLLPWLRRRDENAPHQPVKLLSSNEIQANCSPIESTEVVGRASAPRPISRQTLPSMRAILDSLDVGLLYETLDRRIAFVNHSFTELFGSHTEAASLEGVLAGINAQCKHLVMLDEYAANKKLEMQLNNGKIVTHTLIAVLDDSGKPAGFLRTFTDITHERLTTQQLFYLAEHDFLTGLYNRRHFQDELHRVLDLVTQQANASGALLFFDLDEFKYVNDTFGHRAGDTMLIRVASEVSTLIEGPKVLGRLGGDEFAVLIPNAELEEAEQLGQRIVECISHIPFVCEGQPIRLTTSVGIAIYPRHGNDLEQLISHADAAMYQAKAAGKNNWRAYNPQLDTSRQMLNSMAWNDRIGNAIEQNLLKLHFQGVYNTSNGKLSHAEVLVRMLDHQRPSHFIMPGQFIPIAEKTGAIVEIDRWVLRESIRTLAKHSALRALAVNVSGRSFDDPWLAQYIAETLHAHRVAPDRLIVELTETAAVSDLSDAHQFIDSLQQIGCKVCLDDFGAGFSSFTYLKHLKADVLKIDGQFIRELPKDKDNQIFVKAIVDVARGMNKQTVAEFVEDQSTFEMLREFGVDMAQGYHLDIPRSTPPQAARIA